MRAPVVERLAKARSIASRPATSCGCDPRLRKTRATAYAAGPLRTCGDSVGRVRPLSARLAVGDMVSAAGEPRVVLDGLGFPESTRWRDGRVWLCNWGAGEVLAGAVDGGCEVMARVAPRTLPFSIDWLPDGSLLVVDGPRRLLLGQQPDGTLTRWPT